MSAACGTTTCTSTTALGSTIDIPVTQLSAAFTLGGQPLPTSNPSSADIYTYLVAKDTGQWHALASWYYGGSGSTGTLGGFTVNPRVAAGVYDVYYCHNCSLSTTEVDFSNATDPGDVYPNGLHVLASSVVLGEGAAHLVLDIPVAQLSASFTLGGQPLPTTNESGADIYTYLIAKDTGQWSALASWYYGGSGSTGTLGGFTVNPRVPAGVYDVYYCHNCSLSTTEVDFSNATDPSDVFPSGLHALATNVTLKSGSNSLTFDIPVAQLSATFTLGGQPLPTTNESGADIYTYLIAKDTGQWSALASWYYGGSGSTGTLGGFTVNPRVPAGVYDVYYCHNCSLSTTEVDFSNATDPSDVFPSGLHALATNVTLKSGSNSLTYDIPVAQLSATFTLGGQPLPTTNESGADIYTYLIAKDTGQWSALASWYYGGSGSTGTLGGFTVNPRVPAGVYDVYYCHNCSLSTTEVDFSNATDPSDVFPSGLHALATNVTLKSGSNSLTFDIPVAQLSATFTLGGKALPTTNESGADIYTYLIAKDTGQWSALASWYYGGSGSTGTLGGFTVNPRVPAGVYDVYYCHNCSLSTTEVDFSNATDPSDVFPNGLHALATNVTLKSGNNSLTFDIPVSPLSDTFTLDGESLPTTNESGADIYTYLIAKDTGQWHAFASWYYGGSGSTGALGGFTVNPRVPSGIYDVYYCHNCSLSTTEVDFSNATDPADAFPNGLHILRSCVSVP